MSNQPKTEFIDIALMDAVAEKATQSPRRRMNYNFHRSTDEPINRLLNVMHRGSYLPVHRHLDPARSESIIVVRGKVGLTIYDDAGAEVESRIVGVGCDTVGVDIEAGVWHGLVVLEDDTVLFEVKQGPFAPITPENIASWTPAVEDVAAVEKFVAELERKFEK